MARGLVTLVRATAVDAGYLYLRPRLSLGYGKPFNTWAGLDVNPIASASSAAFTELGLRWRAATE